MISSPAKPRKDKSNIFSSTVIEYACHNVGAYVEVFFSSENISSLQALIITTYYYSIYISISSGRFQLFSLALAVDRICLDVSTYTIFKSDCVGCNMMQFVQSERRLINFRYQRIDVVADSPTSRRRVQHRQYS